MKRLDRHLNGGLIVAPVSEQRSTPGLQAQRCAVQGAEHPVPLHLREVGLPDLGVCRNQPVCVELRSDRCDRDAGADDRLPPAAAGVEKCSIQVKRQSSNCHHDDKGTGDRRRLGRQVAPRGDRRVISPSAGRRSCRVSRTRAARRAGWRLCDPVGRSDRSSWLPRRRHARSPPG